MDCSICSSMPLILRPPRNTICGSCYEAARSAIAFMNDVSQTSNKPTHDKSTLSPSQLKNSFKQGQSLANLTSWVCGIKEREDYLSNKISFLSGLAVALRDQMHADIKLRPGGDGPPIPAHKAVLAARSEIFKNMLDSDSCKAAPSDAITLAELSYEELDSLLNFLYTGNLLPERLDKHVYSLFLAADKYEIQYLQEFCERHLLASLNSSNALDILEMADVCSSKMLKETALSFVVKDVEDIVFSAKYDVFPLKNPHLCVQITRGLLMDAKTKEGP